MRSSIALLSVLRVTATRLAVVAQGPIDSSDSAQVKGFYSSFTYNDEFKKIDVPDLMTQLLPFQKEGVGWMAHREMSHIGGIMADHLGMGKTVQMIGLCLVSDTVNKLFHSSQAKRLSVAAEGNRLLTVIRQMQRISVVANCSRINQPGEDLRNLVIKIEEVMESASAVPIAPTRGTGAKNKKLGSFKLVRTEVDKWLAFAAKFHPNYEKRATAFLNDEEKRDFDMIESKELRTLVVVPAALMLQWQSEIDSKIRKERGITTYLYHGDNKWISSTELETFDFVITTYDTLTNSAQDAFIPGDDERTFAFSRKQAGPIFHIRWKRIILDEAHVVRHAKTHRWRAVQELQGVHRWAVTATPLHNSIQDIQNLLHFVGLPRLPVLPGSSSDDLLSDPYLQRSIARSLQPAFLRRGPIMIRNGVREVLVQLPDKHEIIHKQPFSVKESQMYNGILARSRSAIAASEQKEGTFHIFSMMTRLRQVCCHAWINQGKAVTVSVCGICSSEATAAVTTKCGHTFCHECLLLRFREAVDGDDVATRLPCPACSHSISYNSVFKRQTLNSAERIAQYKTYEFELSTKLRMILKAIHDMRTQHPDDKMIIFSHFTSFMDVITVALEKYGVECLRIDGTMTLTSRNNTIKLFETNPNVKVVLASKTATGVGLNLTVANHVLVVDPWWNPAIEEQAVHRCYRIGQKKPVYVTRFIISDTIEQYCFDICQRKKEFGDAILRAATSGNSGAKAAASKLQELISRLKYVGDDVDSKSETPVPTSSDAPPLLDDAVPASSPVDRAALNGMQAGAGAGVAEQSATAGVAAGSPTKVSRRDKHKHKHSSDPTTTRMASSKQRHMVGQHQEVTNL